MKRGKIKICCLLVQWGLVIAISTFLLLSLPRRQDAINVKAPFYVIPTAEVKITPSIIAIVHIDMNPTGKYIFKVDNRKTRARSKIC